MPEKKTYSYGARFLVDGVDEVILAGVGDSQAALISLRTGNRRADPIHVENASAITPDELRRMTVFRFTLPNGDPIEPPKPRTFNTGSRFNVHGQEVLLVACGLNRVVLARLDDGAFYSTNLDDSTEVKDYAAVTEDEITAMVRGLMPAR